MTKAALISIRPVWVEKILNGEYSFDCEWKRPLTRPPQSWCYVEELK